MTFHIQMGALLEEERAPTAPGAGRPPPQPASHCPPRPRGWPTVAGSLMWQRKKEKPLCLRVPRHGRAGSGVPVCAHGGGVQLLPLSLEIMPGP